MISAERLSGVSELSELNGTAHYLSKTEQRSLCDELLAARARIASLEAEKSKWAYHVMVPIDEHDRMEAALRAQGLSQEDREACLRAAVMNEQRAGFHSSWKYGDGPEAKPFRDDAAILRRLGGQTT